MFSLGFRSPFVKCILSHEKRHFGTFSYRLDVEKSRKEHTTASIAKKIEGKEDEDVSKAFPSGGEPGDAEIRSREANDLKSKLQAFIKSENVQKFQSEIAKFKEERAKRVVDYSKSFSKRLAEDEKELRSSVSIASKIINDITGYSSVLRLKDNITQKEKNLRDLRRAIKESKAASVAANENRMNSQQQMNELLERKHTWSSSDLEKFTGLYRSDHELEKQVQESAAKLKALESKEDETHAELIQGIMDRYHEEQVWSDKIRQISTWGTFCIMCINLLVVLIVQFFFEPLKRAKLVNSFELKVKDLFVSNESLAQDVHMMKEMIVKRDEMLANKSETPLLVTAEKDNTTDQLVESNTELPLDSETSTAEGRNFSYPYLSPIQSVIIRLKHILSTVWKPLSMQANSLQQVVTFSRSDFFIFAGLEFLMSFTLGLFVLTLWS